MSAPEITSRAIAQTAIRLAQENAARLESGHFHHSAGQMERVEFVEVDHQTVMGRPPNGQPLLVRLLLEAAMDELDIVGSLEAQGDGVWMLEWAAPGR